MNRNRSKWLSPTLGLFAFAMIWQLASAVSKTPEHFPGFFETSRVAITLLNEGYWKDFAATAGRATVGWLLGMCIGILLGVAAGSSLVVWDHLRPVLAFVRNIPAFLLITIPLGFGVTGEPARVLVIFAAVCWIVIDECSESMVRRPSDVREVLLAKRHSHWFITQKILFFEVLERAFVPASRTTAAIAFVVAVVVESLAIPSHGVGARLLTFLAAADMRPVFAFISLTGITGVLLSQSINTLARRLIFWS